MVLVHLFLQLAALAEATLVLGKDGSGEMTVSPSVLKEGFPVQTFTLIYEAVTETVGGGSLVTTNLSIDVPSDLVPDDDGIEDDVTVRIIGDSDTYGTNFSTAGDITTLSWDTLPIGKKEKFEVKIANLGPKEGFTTGELMWNWEMNLAGGCRC